MEMMDIVDVNDQVIGQASRDEIYDKKLTHRIAHVLIWDDQGRMLIHKRSADCSFCPLHWSMSAAGHVDAGESYEIAAARELREELGVDLPLTFMEKFYYVDDPRGIMKFIAVFRAVSNGPFQLNQKEVAEVKFLTVDGVKTMIKNNEPFHPQFLFVFQTLLDQLTA